MLLQSYIAATRFGLGPRFDELGTIESSPLGWLTRQIQMPERASVDFAGLASSTENARKVIAARQMVKQSGDKDAMKDIRKAERQVFVEEMRLKAQHAINTPTPFYERLVNFWSNHFSISVQKNATIGLAAAFEREALRPYIVGRFSDMLLAVTHHPAMLIYLDNFQSVGPNSRAGLRNAKGLNENLAREIMELHTLGVDAGYSQADVTSFAKVLTGWGIGDARSGDEGGFYFYANRHEPGTQTVFGKTYADSGEAQGRQALIDFANHPATAHHLAFKLARHFIADTPPMDAVSALADAFQKTSGDLQAVYRVLIERPEAWSLDQPKIKSSYDLVISALRLCGDAGVDPLWYLQSLKFLGNVPLTANSPAGFADTAKDIAGPEAVLRRIEWAKSAAGKLNPALPLGTLVDLSIGPILSPATRAALSGVGSNQKLGLALLLGSPEFQRR